MVNVLIVDDSQTETAILKNIMEQDNNLHVIACAKNGKEAIEMAKRFKPDLITMDIQMPIMDGLEATRHIMSECPTPIVVISSKLSNKEINTTFLALEAGALAVMEKPTEINSKNFVNTQKNIISMLKAMAEIKVIKRRLIPKITPPTLPAKHFTREYEIIAIGTSVGGPQVLKKILSELPGDFPIPIVIVQHMTLGFMSGFTQWLNDTISLHVKDAEHSEILQPGTVYFAPDNFHFEVARTGQRLISRLVKGDPVSGFCPSITVLLASVAKTCNKHAIGMLLTGMGSDGAQGLLELKKSGGHTLIQDPKSTIVFGMAGVAQSLGAVDKVIELDQIANYLVNGVKNGEIKD